MAPLKRPTAVTTDRSMTVTRERIKQYVSVKPGIHFSGIERDLDLATGQVQYHLKRLTNNGDLIADDIAGRTHFFEPGVSSFERQVIAFLRRETAREIMLRLASTGSMAPVELAADLDLARSTIYWHIETLAAHGIVVRESDGSRVSLADPAVTEAILADISPTLPETVIDRFMRTIDSLFDAVEE